MEPLDILKFVSESNFFDNHGAAKGLDGAHLFRLIENHQTAELSNRLW